MRVPTSHPSPARETGARGAPSPCVICQTPIDRPNETAAVPPDDPMTCRQRRDLLGEVASPEAKRSALLCRREDRMVRPVPRSGRDITPAAPAAPAELARRSASRRPMVTGCGLHGRGGGFTRREIVCVVGACLGTNITRCAGRRIPSVQPDGKRPRRCADISAAFRRHTAPADPSSNESMALNVDRAVSNQGRVYTNVALATTDKKEEE